MTDLARVPVVVGGGQFTNRNEDPESSPDPFELMTEAAGQAAASAGSKDWLARLTHCWMVHSISVRHGDPAGEVARRIGAPAGTESRCSGMGGNIPQWLVNRAADLVSSGSRPVVLIVGAEALATRRRAKKAGIRLDWPTSDGWPDMWPPLEPDMGVHPLEDAHGLRQATTVYALIESAIAHAAGEGRVAHNKAIGELMAGLNEVAVANPYSWFPERRDAVELVTVTKDNRMIATPYPKYLNAVMDVDMSAAVIVTDAETARERGIAPDAVAYLRGWADASEVWYLSQRAEVHRSPALESCFGSALGTAGVTLDEISAFDLYSCFPSSVEVSRDAIGVGRADPRPLTLTGGLPYHGGPGSNYVTHAVCNAVEHVRSGAGHVVVHGNGYYLTKHAVGVYSAEAPDSVPEPGGGQDLGTPTLTLEPDASGPARIVAWTVPYGRDGDAEPGIIIAETPSGTRTIALADAELTKRLAGSDGDLVGETVKIVPGEKSNLATSP
jgi:acetyl-CoA C-acetyltransferase